MIALCIGACSRSGVETRNVIKAGDLKVMGRSAATDSTLELITSAAHFGVTFKGTECKLLVSISSWQDHNYLQYELDSVYQKRLRVNRGEDTLVITAPSDGNHVLWIYKATEAHTGPIFVRHIVATDVHSLNVPERPVIEFIGNSITCGAASDPSDIPCDSGEYHDHHNAYMAYGPRVARSLHAEFVLSSVSGIGIYRNWNSDSPIMPAVYENTDMQEGSLRKWNFNTYQPAVVSIALGTNDFSRGDGKKPRLPFDSARFIAGYVNFVKTVKSKYPQAKIALLTSPMVSGSDDEIFVDCLNKVKRQIDLAYPSDKPVSLFFFSPITPRGCSYHPSVEDHELMADQLLPFFKELL